MRNLGLNTIMKRLIGTHNGTFHCDEALAVFLLRNIETYRDASLVRTRDPAILEKCDIVVDVGAVYDENIQRFDHHQRGFSETFGYGFSTKLSSAGLIYKHYGKQIISNHLDLAESDPKIETLWLKLYAEFIEAIDAIDNGISQYIEEVTPRYKNRTDLSSRVSWLNPAWNDTISSEKVDSLFVKASTLAGEEFFSRLRYYGQSWLPARDIILTALNSRFSIDPSGKILKFDKFAPWKEHLFEIESEQKTETENQTIYVLYPDETTANWRIQAVPVSSNSFESRKSLPKAWCGLRDETLSEVTNIPGCIFVHASGFIGGNATEDGVLAMAKKALSII